MRSTYFVPFTCTKIVQVPIFGALNETNSNLMILSSYNDDGELVDEIINLASWLKVLTYMLSEYS